MEERDLWKEWKEFDPHKRWDDWRGESRWEILVPVKSIIRVFKKLFGKKEKRR